MLRQEEEFIEYFDRVKALVHHQAKKSGWWEEHTQVMLGCQPKLEKWLEASLIMAKFMLVVSELGEAVDEGVRKGKDTPSTKIKGYTAIEEEVADVIIRLMDTSAYYGWNVAGAVIEKMHYNAGREHKHGGKVV